jgi:hypothetical protein
MVSVFESLVLRDLSGSVQNSGLMEMVWVAVSGPQTCATSRSRFFVAGVQPVALSVPGEDRTKFLGVSRASTAFTADKPIITLWRVAGALGPNHSTSLVCVTGAHVTSSLILSEINRTASSRSRITVARNSASVMFGQIGSPSIDKKTSTFESGVVFVVTVATST